jgi:hypothetical protein
MISNFEKYDFVKCLLVCVSGGDLFGNTISAKDENLPLMFHIASTFSANARRQPYNIVN